MKILQGVVVLSPLDRLVALRDRVWSWWNTIRSMVSERSSRVSLANGGEAEEVIGENGGDNGAEGEARDVGVQEARYDEVDLGSPTAHNPYHESYQTTSNTTTSQSFHLSQFPLPPQQTFIPSRRATSQSHHSTGTSLSTTSTAVETAIQKRWLKGLSFGSGAWCWTDGPKQDMKVTSACVLFWIGFIAPWCWLIGGWYLSASGEMQPDGQYLQTVDLKWPRRDRKSSLPLSTATAATAAVGNAGRYSRMKKNISRRWNVFLGRPDERDVLPISNPTASTLFPCMHWVDPWVVRCRIAAVVSGVVIFVGVIIALIVLAGLHRTS